MTFKKIIGKLHLWLGLASGLLVFFLGITGCMLVFEKEIQSLTEPLNITPQSKQYMLPTQLKAIAETKLDGKKVVGIEFPGGDKAALAYYYDATDYFIVLLNPYNGAVLKVKNMNRDFFRVVTIGHYYLWLPPNIGQPVLASATLIFVIMMITGMVLWWPKNKAARKQRFKVKWNAKWRRVNYDLHNVLGFYMTWVCLFIALTGLVMGFQWFAKSVYWVSSGGKAMVEHADPLSDTTKATATAYNNADVLWLQMYPKVPAGAGATLYFAATNSAPLEFFVNHKPGTYYKQDAYHFDQYTLKELPAKGSFAGKYKDASAADKISRMNYDIHVGAIGGLTTKIIAFFGSLIAASLPVTGFLVWRGRNKKTKKGIVKPAQVKSGVVV